MLCTTYSKNKSLINFNYIPNALIHSNVFMLKPAEKELLIGFEYVIKNMTNNFNLNNQ
jgi:hypothetical protein